MVSKLWLGPENQLTQTTPWVALTGMARYVQMLPSPWTLAHAHCYHL